MNRRAFIAGLGSIAAWPVQAWAQRTTSIVGVLSGSGPAWSQDTRKAFVLGLQEAGYIEGKNVALEYRWTAGEYAKLPELAAQLVRDNVSVIFAVGNANAAKAAMGATSSVPIVFANGGDPVGLGLVASMSRPGR